MDSVVENCVRIGAGAWSWDGLVGEVGVGSAVGVLGQSSQEWQIHKG